MASEQGTHVRFPLRGAPAAIEVATSGEGRPRSVAQLSGRVEPTSWEEQLIGSALALLHFASSPLAKLGSLLLQFLSMAEWRVAALFDRFWIAHRTAHRMHGKFLCGLRYC